jgi:hypothetical protein
VQNCSLHVIQTDSVAHPTYNPKDTKGSFPGGGGGQPGNETDHLALVSRPRISGSMHKFPHTSSWHSAELVKHRDNF